MRVKFNFPADDGQWVRPMNSAKCIVELKKLGVEVVDEGQDVTFQDTCVDDVEPNTVILDRFDTSAATSYSVEKHESNPDVLGYVLPIRSRGTSISHGVWNEPPPSNKPTRSITTLPWDQVPGLTLHVLPKRFDVTFAGTVYYPSIPFATAHRSRLMANWHQVARNKTVSVFGGRPRLLSWQDSYNLAARSKVVVSPWGVCEISWRDYEAVLGCAMIVKPRQPSMDVSCNPWQDNVVYCEPDFSDIGDAARVALEQYDAKREYLEGMRRELIEYSHMDYLANGIRDMLLWMLSKKEIEFYPHSQQSPAMVPAFEALFSDWKPDYIIELGTGKGGLAKHLVDYGAVLSIDKKEELREVTDDRVTYIEANVFEDAVEANNASLMSKGKTLLICDGGNKPEEFCRYSKYLKSGDVVMVHDYFDTAADFERARAARIWDWWECCQNRITTTGLQRIHRGVMRNAAWGCWRKL